ncbi:MAG TPA: hypothetical protein VNN80_13215, partial [Polyangiaceae bacterium]|nr:hypothetical protein [Polyangiaceae bacterium]
VRVADTGSAFPGVGPGGAGASSAESSATGVLPSTPRMSSGSATGVAGSGPGTAESPGEAQVPPSPDGQSLPSAPAVLSANSTLAEFGPIAVGSAAPPFTWTVQNTGGTATGSLSLRSATQALLAAPFALQANGCVGPLAPGASCSVTFSFAPFAAGVFSSDIELGDGVRGVRLSLAGQAGYPLTVTRVGTGDITSDTGELSCEGSTCEGFFTSSTVTLTARTSNGSEFFFADWSSNDCFANQNCTFDLTTTASTTATFLAKTNNLIFTNEGSYPPDLGGLSAYDAECNRLADAAGINDASGNAYIAAMSDSTSSLRQRLGTARGWVRMDGNPFGDTVASIFDDAGVIYSASFDEIGALYQSSSALLPRTGTLSNGSSAPDNCSNWTSSSGAFSSVSGRAAGGPIMWLDRGGPPLNCDATGEFPLVCMGRTRSAPLPPLVRKAGKQIWTVFDYTPGSTTPDQRCQSERPPGVAAAAALVAYTDRAAQAVLVPDATYVRPDGALVGLGRNIARQIVLASPWLAADGTFNANSGFGVWSGAYRPDQLATTENCDDWRNGTEALRGTFGDYAMGEPRWFNTFGIIACSTAFALYCVEQ